jgi:hypothetical protein
LYSSHFSSRPRAQQFNTESIFKSSNRSQGRRASRSSRSKDVRIGRTPVGKGVFAGKRYVESDIIGEIFGDLIDDPNYGSWYCMNLDNGSVLEPHAPFRFVNHSCEPNCELDYFDLREPHESETRRRLFLIALREIKPAAELTIAYNWLAKDAIACRCGEPTCCGWIVDPDELDAIGKE